MASPGCHRNVDPVPVASAGVHSARSERVVSRVACEGAKSSPASARKNATSPSASARRRSLSSIAAITAARLGVPSVHVAVDQLQETTGQLNRDPLLHAEVVAPVPAKRSEVVGEAVGTRGSVWIRTVAPREHRLRRIAHPRRTSAASAKRRRESVSREGPPTALPARRAAGGAWSWRAARRGGCRLRCIRGPGCSAG